MFPHKMTPVKGFMHQESQSTKTSLLGNWLPLVLGGLHCLLPLQGECIINLQRAVRSRYRMTPAGIKGSTEGIHPRFFPKRRSYKQFLFCSRSVLTIKFVSSHYILSMGIRNPFLSRGMGGLLNHRVVE